MKVKDIVKKTKESSSEYWSRLLKTKVIDLKCEACGSALSLSVIKDNLIGWRLFCRHCSRTPVISHRDFNKVITTYIHPETQKRFEEENNMLSLKEL